METAPNRRWHLMPLRYPAPGDVLSATHTEQDMRVMP
jgi:hypothetical protein